MANIINGKSLVKNTRNLIWNGWKYLSRTFEVIVSDMTAFWVGRTYYELTMYFDAWNKEIIGYRLSITQRRCKIVL